MRKRGVACSSGKVRYSSEADALVALVRVRKDRVRTGDPREHESHLYPCIQCDGWHLSSTPVLRPEDFGPESPQRINESPSLYTRRLERRIAEQRAQLLSLHALGHGGDNRESRKRIAALVVALGRMTERWEKERENREALVERLAAIEGPTSSRRTRWLWRVA